MALELAFPAFIAGILTFLAPCTLPLVPGYLGFISGVSFGDLKQSTLFGKARRKILLNGLLYVIGFSVVFVLLGSLVGLGGAALVQYRWLLSQIGGVFIILFGLFMTGVLRLPFLRFLQGEKHISLGGALKPGNPTSSFLFGATFAFGWTPCVGPILGSILILATASGTVGQGAILLAVFSLGLAIPFLLVAAGVGWAAKHLTHIAQYLNWVSVVGGIFLIFLGILLVTNQFGIFIAWFFEAFGFLQLEERLLNYL